MLTGASPAGAQGAFARRFNGRDTPYVVISGDYRLGFDYDSTVQVIDAADGYRAVDLISFADYLVALELLPESHPLGDFVTLDRQAELVLWKGLPARAMRRWQLPEQMQSPTVVAGRTLVVDGTAGVAPAFLLANAGILWSIDLDSGGVTQIPLETPRLLRAVEADADSSDELLVVPVLGPPRVLDLPGGETLMAGTRELTGAVVAGQLDTDRASELIATAEPVGSGLVRIDLLPAWNEVRIHSGLLREPVELQFWDANADGRDDWLAVADVLGLALFSPSAGAFGFAVNLRCGPHMVIAQLDADPGIEALCGGRDQQATAAAAEFGRDGLEWSADWVAGEMGIPVLGDVDGDGREEVVVATQLRSPVPSSVLLFHDADTLDELVRLPVGPEHPATLHHYQVTALVKTAASGPPDLALARMDGSIVTMLNMPDGQVRWRSQQLDGSPLRLTPVDADLDGLEELALLRANRPTALAQLEGVVALLDSSSGALIWDRALGGSGQAIIHQLIATDLDGDGRDELVAAFAGRLTALAASDGSPIWSRALAVTDVDPVTYLGTPVLLATGASVSMLLDPGSGATLATFAGGADAVSVDGELDDVIARRGDRIGRRDLITGRALGSPLIIGNPPSHGWLDAIERPLAGTTRKSLLIATSHGLTRLSIEAPGILHSNGFE